MALLAERKLAERSSPHGPSNRLQVVSNLIEDVVSKLPQGAAGTTDEEGSQLRQQDGLAWMAAWKEKSRGNRAGQRRSGADPNDNQGGTSAD